MLLFICLAGKILYNEHGWIWGGGSRRVVEVVISAVVFSRSRLVSSLAMRAVSHTLPIEHFHGE